MNAIGICRLHKGTNLRETCRIKPAFPSAALNGDAVSLRFVGAYSLMGALMTVYP